MAKSRIKYRDYFLSIAKIEADIYKFSKIANSTYDPSVSIFSFESTCKIIAQIDRRIAILDLLEIEDVDAYKYDNLPAMATMAQYFNDAACTKLKGKNGVYAKYDNDLKNGLIVGTIEDALKDLDAIKETQYYLYELICKANAFAEDYIKNIQV